MNPVSYIIVRRIISLQKMSEKVVELREAAIEEKAQM